MCMIRLEGRELVGLGLEVPAAGIGPPAGRAMQLLTGRD